MAFFKTFPPKSKKKSINITIKGGAHFCNSQKLTGNDSHPFCVPLFFSEANLDFVMIKTPK